MDKQRVYVCARPGRQWLHLCWKVNGRVKWRSCGTDDAADAELQRREFEQELRTGKTDPYAVHLKRPLREHAEDYHQFLLASGTSLKQARQVRHRIHRILDATGMVVVRDLTPAKIKTAVATMKFKPQNGKHEENWPQLSAQTRNFYIAAIKQFIRWMQVDRRIPDNPLIGLKGENAAIDRKHDRRALTDTEIAKLVTAARASTQVIEGMTGEERARVYTLALATGLRRGEIASLKRQSFDLDAAHPTVTLEAAYSKHRRKDVLPLHPDLVLQLRVWFKVIKPGDRLFPDLAHRKTFKMIRKDLKAAGLQYKDANGKFADFHSLRHTFITRAWRTGATPDVIRALARHCDINLTLRYTHTTPAAQADAMKKMPALPRLSAEN